MFAEDNNTRVLFERVLSSGSLEPEKSVYVYISHLSEIVSFICKFIISVIEIYGIVSWNSNLILVI